jgi:hypothetical protein
MNREFGRAGDLGGNPAWPGIVGTKESAIPDPLPDDLARRECDRRPTGRQSPPMSHQLTNHLGSIGQERGQIGRGCRSSASRCAVIVDDSVVVARKRATIAGRRGGIFRDASADRPEMTVNRGRPSDGQGRSGQGRGGFHDGRGRFRGGRARFGVGREETSDDHGRFGEGRGGIPQWSWAIPWWSRTIRA